MTSDLPPSSRTSVKAVKSVNQENDGAIGNSVTGTLNWLTDSDLNYRSDSALYRSVQTNGVLGTVGLAVAGTVKGTVAPIDALYRNDVNAFGRSLPGTALAAVGPLAKFGNLGIGAEAGSLAARLRISRPNSALSFRLKKLSSAQKIISRVHDAQRATVQPTIGYVLEQHQKAKSTVQQAGRYVQVTNKFDVLLIWLRGE